MDLQTDGETKNAMLKGPATNTHGPSCYTHSHMFIVPKDRNTNTAEGKSPHLPAAALLWFAAIIPRTMWSKWRNNTQAELADERGIGGVLRATVAQAIQILIPRRRTVTNSCARNCWLRQFVSFPGIWTWKCNSIPDSRPRHTRLWEHDTNDWVR